ncbi:MAG: HypC/HybG/HupF family hydrogenase formation chaperone [Marinilabiliales bacterium]|nr:MAG: HypC/HybG/HupF family hydrogenase formation chaperone [Marinilabiliales bacterium]
MCISIPARVDKIEKETAVCTVGTSSYNASLELLVHEEVHVGDYVLIHTGFAIQKLDAEEAEASLKTFDEFKALNNALDEEEKITKKRVY